MNSTLLTSVLCTTLISTLAFSGPVGEDVMFYYNFDELAQGAASPFSTVNHIWDEQEESLVPDAALTLPVSGNPTTYGAGSLRWVGNGALHGAAANVKLLTAFPAFVPPPSGSWTLTFWATRAAADGGSAGRPILISHGAWVGGSAANQSYTEALVSGVNGTGTQGFAFYVISNTGEVAFRYYTEDSNGKTTLHTLISEPKEWVKNAWHHIAVVCDRNGEEEGTLAIYIDGAPATQKVYVEGELSTADAKIPAGEFITAPAGTTQQTQLNTARADGSAMGTDNALDDIVLWSRALAEYELFFLGATGALPLSACAQESAPNPDELTFLGQDVLFHYNFNTLPGSALPVSSPRYQWDDTLKNLVVSENFSLPITGNPTGTYEPSNRNPGARRWAGNGTLNGAVANAKILTPFPEFLPPATGSWSLAFWAARSGALNDLRPTLLTQGASLGNKGYSEVSESDFLSDRSGHQRGFGFYAVSGGRIGFRFYTQVGEGAPALNTLLSIDPVSWDAMENTTNQGWAHVAVTCSREETGQGLVTLYVNGVPQTQTTLPVDSAILAPEGEGWEYTLNTTHDGTTAMGLANALDDLTLWTRALTHSEVSFLGTSDALQLVSSSQTDVPDAPLADYTRTVTGSTSRWSDAAWTVGGDTGQLWAGTSAVSAALLTDGGSALTVDTAPEMAVLLIDRQIGVSSPTLTLMKDPAAAAGLTAGHTVINAAVTAEEGAAASFGELTIQKSLTLPTFTAGLASDLQLAPGSRLTVTGTVFDASGTAVEINGGALEAENAVFRLPSEEGAAFTFLSGSTAFVKGLWAADSGSSSPTADFRGGTVTIGSDGIRVEGEAQILLSGLVNVRAAEDFTVLSSAAGGFRTTGAGGQAPVIDPGTHTVTFGGEAPTAAGIGGTGGIVIGTPETTGNVVFNAPNTYTGETLVQGGTLIVNQRDTAMTGALTVAAGAALSGTGVIPGALTLRDGAVLKAAVSSGAYTSLTASGAVSLAGSDTAGIDITGISKHGFNARATLISWTTPPEGTFVLTGENPDADAFRLEKRDTGLVLLGPSGLMILLY